MSNIIINNTNNTIELTKTFATKAQRYGTKEYFELQKVRKDYPNFTVATKKAVKKENYKGLTIPYMFKYIKNHNIELTYENEMGEKVKVMAFEAFKEMAALDDNGKKIKDAESASYGSIKGWFFEAYPAVKKDHTEKNEKKAKINMLLTAKKAA